MCTKVNDFIRGSHHSQVFENWCELERQLLGNHFTGEEKTVIIPVWPQKWILYSKGVETGQKDWLGWLCIVLNAKMEFVLQVMWVWHNENGCSSEIRTVAMGREK